MQYEHLDLRKVEIDPTQPTLTKMFGLSEEESQAFADKMAIVIQAVHEDKYTNIPDVVPVVFPQLTSKEAALLIARGIETGIVETLEKAAPMIALAKLLNKAKQAKV